MGYNYLPGVQVVTNDGGLALTSTPTGKQTIILGTSASGPAGTPYQVIDRAVAASSFGLQGSLIQAMEEVAQGGADNILLFRIGTRSASLSGIGAEVDNGGHPLSAAHVGYSISFGQITPTLANDYQVFYDGAGLLEIWYKGNQVYSNSTSNPVDTGDCTVTGTAIGGEALLNSGASNGASHYAKSLPLSNALISASAPISVPASGGAITRFTITGGTGANYATAPTVTVSGAGSTGSGFTGTAVVSGGNLTGITITAGGQGYVAPVTVTLTGGSPTTAATATATASAIVPAFTEPGLVFDLGSTGLAVTPGSVGYDPCALYEALQDAYTLLEIMPVEQAYPANVQWDTPNVAFYTSTAATTDINNPANGSALGWLKTSLDANNNVIYTWAHKTKDSTGATVVPPTFSNPADRISQGFHEVHFAYQLARFAAKQSANQGGCIGFIGFAGPKNYKPAGLKTWIGGLPTFDANVNFSNQNVGNPVTAGSGLLGTPLLVGTTASKLNSLCPEVPVIGYRLPGIFQTVSAADATQFGEYDEAVVIDGNGYKTDIGSFVHAVGDWALLSNSYATTYVNNIAGVVCGFASQLDEKSALTNKALPGVTQLYRLTMAQMNNLVQAKINVLRFKGDNVQPAMLHDRSVALLTSDYTFLLRTRIKFLVTEILFQEADKYIGQSSTDGLTIAALKTALDGRLVSLQKRNYLSGYAFNVYATQASQRIGQLFVQIVFSPANELVKIDANVSAGNS